MIINPYIYSGFVQEGKYTFAELDDLITNQNYIPVATEDEFNDLRTTTSQTMGAGSPWEDTYTTGTDKKYVQVKHLDFTSFGTFTSYPAWTGIYDGNELNIDNISIIKSLFNGALSTSQEVKNIRGSFSYNGSVTSGLIASTLDGGVIDNIIISASIISTVANFGGIVSSLTSGNLTNCGVSGTASLTSNSGGIVAKMTGGLISKCYSNLVITVTGSTVGSVVGEANGGTIEKTYALGSLTNTGSVLYNSGFVGLNYTNINNCYSWVDVDVASGSYVGGFVGRNLNTSAIITNSYSVGSVSGSSNVGGFCGANNNTITSCYYDSVTSGQSDTGKGEPKTTTEMYEGEIPDTTIYVGWSPTIWDYVDTLSYPILK